MHRSSSPARWRTIVLIVALLALGAAVPPSAGSATLAHGRAFLFKDITPGGGGTNVGWPLVVNGIGLFGAENLEGLPNASSGLWRTDGKPEGTALVKNMRPPYAGAVMAG